MTDPLRSKLIKLAHENPELRPHLLPLIKTAGHPDNDIGPVLIALVGKNLGMGREWNYGSNYEMIGDEILYFIRSGGQAAMLHALMPVIKKLIVSLPEDS